MNLKSPLKDHARLGASSAHRWMQCPGTIRMSEGLPAIETDYQFEGTAAHALLEYAMRYEGIAGLDILLQDVQAVEIERVDGTWITWPVDQEMVAAVMMVVDVVTAEVARYLEVNPGHFIQTEAERTYSLAALAPPEAMFGTADITLRAPKRLHVFDLKYGRGVVVEVLDNEQLRMYLVGAIVDAGLAAPADVWAALTEEHDATDVGIALRGSSPVTALDVGLSLFEEFAITIIQPRAPHTHGPVRTEVVTESQVREFARELLARAADTQADDAPLVPGEHCKFCPAKGYCPALQQRAAAIAAVEFGNTSIDERPLIVRRHIDRLSIEDVAEAATQAVIVKEWLRGIELRLYSELLAGATVPGWKLVMKKGKRQWIESSEETARVLGLMGLTPDDIYEPPIVRSPAQIEKIIGRGRLPKEMAPVVSSGLTVAPAWDPRTEYDPTQVESTVVQFLPVEGSPSQTDKPQTEEE